MSLKVWQHSGSLPDCKGSNRLNYSDTAKVIKIKCSDLRINTLNKQRNRTPNSILWSKHCHLEDSRGRFLTARQECKILHTRLFFISARLYEKTKNKTIKKSIGLFWGKWLTKVYNSQIIKSYKILTFIY